MRLAFQEHSINSILNVANNSDTLTLLWVEGGNTQYTI